MAKEQLRPLALRHPGDESRGIARPVIRYNPATDTLLLYLYGQPEAALNVSIEDSSMYVMIDPDTSELVGVHIQAFEKRFLAEHPYFRNYEIVQRLINLYSEQPADNGQWESDPESSKALAELVMGNLIVEHGALASAS